MILLHNRIGEGIGKYSFPTFSFPDTGGGSGADRSAGTAANGAGGGSGGVELLDPKLFDQLPWNELDDETQAVLNKIKSASVATLQSRAQLETEKNRIDGIARQHQSRADRLEADAKRTQQTRAGGAGGGEPAADPYLSAVAEELAGAGFGDEESKRLAPVFAGMFKKVGNIERERLGKDLGPMASQVLATQAHSAFVTATQQDELGMFQAPEVQQAVWDLVRERVNQGVDTSPEIVLNLAKMAYADKLLADKKGGGSGGEGGGAPAAPQPQLIRGVLPAQPPTMNTGGLMFQTQGTMPISQRQADPNAAKTQLNEDTRNALASSFRTMLAGTNIVPTELAPFIKPSGATRRRK
jgi:hypothetical protein